MAIVMALGVLAVIVSLWDKFGTPRYRPYRALVFIVFGLSGIAPATHYAIQNGWEKSINEAAMGWLVFMGFLYITGALLYAFRIPERFFPGKVDILVILLLNYAGHLDYDYYTFSFTVISCFIALLLLELLFIIMAYPIWLFTG